MTETELASAIASIAAHESWDKTPDRAARTAPARQAMLDKFYDAVDPDGIMSPPERAKAAEDARRAYFKRLALMSVQARQARRLAREAGSGLKDGGAK